MVDAQHGRATRAAGRKRDPLIEPRVFNAAIRSMPGTAGGGFSFEAVARAAGVGKPAIYRRWSNREQLLVAALDVSDFPTARDCGSIRADLLDYASQWVHWYEYPDRALAARRIIYDCEGNLALHALHEQLIVRPRTDAARDITRRAVRRGEIAKGLRSSTIVDLLVGALSTHWEMTSPSGRLRLRRNFPAYAESIVDIILSGVQVVSDSTMLASIASGRSSLDKA